MSDPTKPTQHTQHKIDLTPKTQPLKRTQKVHIYYSENKENWIYETEMEIEDVDRLFRIEAAISIIQSNELDQYQFTTTIIFI